MKEKIKKITKKVKDFVSKKQPEPLLSMEEELESLRKENKILKAGFPDFALEKCRNRRSIRKFSDEKVDWKTIYNILEASFNAPCAGNIQNFKVIVIGDEKKKKEIAKCAFRQFWITQAPTVLIVTREDEEVKKEYFDEGALYSVQNVSAFVENILLLASMHDLGACWVGAYHKSELKKLLEVPENVEIDAIIPVGHPIENPEIDKNIVESMLFFDEFGKKVKGKF